MDKSYKQKKDWRKEFRKKFVSGRYRLVEKEVDVPYSEKEITQFISSLIDETEKQTQSEMSEDFTEKLKYLRQCSTGEKYPYWEKSERPDLIVQEIDDILTNLNKTK